jgi:hypothetical protein
MTPAELLKVYNALDNSRKVQPLRIVLVDEQAPGAAPVLLDRADAAPSRSHDPDRQLDLVAEHTFDSVPQHPVPLERVHGDFAHEL